MKLLWSTIQRRAKWTERATEHLATETEYSKVVSWRIMNVKFCIFNQTIKDQLSHKYHVCIAALMNTFTVGEHNRIKKIKQYSQLLQHPPIYYHKIVKLSDFLFCCICMFFRSILTNLKLICFGVIFFQINFCASRRYDLNKHNLSI